LIYELTADTFDATEAAAWTSTGNGAAMTVEGGRLRLIADPGSVDGAMIREAVDAEPGRFVLVVEVDQASAINEVGACAPEASFFLSAGAVHSNVAERYLVALDVDTTSTPITPAFRYLTMSDPAWPVYIDRFAIYRVDDRHLIDQLEFQVLTPGDTGFRLDTDELGTGELGSRATATAWTDYLPDATGLTIDRGADTDGVETTTQVGTANLTVRAPQDAPPGLGLRPNLPIRFRSKLTGTVAYTGAVADLTDTWRKPTDPRPVQFMANIPCVDAVRDLAGISRNGALGIDRWADRVRRIMASYPGAWEFAPGTSPDTYWPVCSRTVYESTLDKHLQLAVNTSAGRWYVDRDNVIRVEASNWSAQERPVRLSFTDGSDGLDPDYNPAVRFYTDLVRTYDTRALVNDLSFNNHDAVLNDQGQWVANDQALGPFTNRTSAATYGVRHADLDTTLETGPGDPDTDAVPTSDPAGDLVAEYTRDNAKPAIRFSQLTYDATNDVDVACSLDVFDLVLVTNGEITDQQNRIIGIRHDITTVPERWLVTLTLQAWSVS
jgi:hypothetical protein